MTDMQAERMADAYNFGIKADALREFADHLDAIEPYVPMTAPAIAADARVKAADLDARAEALAVAAEPAPPAELTEARCWSCDHLATDHQSDGCHHPITRALVSVETADFDALCSCAVSAESAATPEES